MRYSGMIVLLLTVAGTAPSASAQARATAEVELQAARNVEEVEGNLTRAIDLYKGIVAKYGSERDIAAQALLSLGRSYEKLGSQEAARAYQRVVAEYGDQSAAAAQARARLGALQANSAAGSDRGPVARRLLSSADTDNDNFVSMRPSPDGGQVAYIEMGVTGPLGALQLRDLRSGAVQTLVPGSPGWNWSPTWSPDGTRIAFLEATTGALKIVEVGTRRVSEVPGTAGQALGPADWSRDGRFLLCARQLLPSRLGAVLVSPTSGEVTPLADSASGGSFSPDSRFVVFTVREGGEQHLFVQPVTGGPARQLTSGDGTDLYPLWSPDGKAIAYQRSSGIWVIPVMNGVANGAPRRVLGQAEPMSTPASWVANGLYYTFYNISTAAYQLPVEPATARPAGSAQRLPAPADPFLTWVRSPDGRQTAFAAMNGTITIRSEDSKSTATFSLGSESLGSEGASWNAWWSGDGNEVLYTSTFRSRQGMGATILALDPKTSKVRTLLPRRLMANRMSMSADGRRVVFGLGSDTLVIIGPGRGDSIVVTSEDAPDGRLSGYVRLQFSPDGRQLLFGRQGPPNKAGGSLWVAGSDGNGMRKIASAPVLTGAVWDPSGRFIAYSSFIVYPPNLRRAVVRVVELASGTEWELPLSVEAGFLRVTDWSRDGRYIGLTAREDRYEYWVAEHILDTGW